jgi:hypothetical protein
MRYRLMASYLGASYQAAVGPSDRDVTLFAAPPPPEEHGFSPAPGGIWRKQVKLNDIDALWESRPIGSYHGEPCLVLDDLGDRLHVVYLGMDERRANQLGYWQVDRGVFEVVVPRHEVTDLAEERHEFPITVLLSTLSALSPPQRALGAAEPARMQGFGPGGGPPGGMQPAHGGQPALAGQPGGQPGGQPALAGQPGGQPALAGQPAGQLVAMGQPGGPIPSRPSLPPSTAFAARGAPQPQAGLAPAPTGPAQPLTLPAQPSAGPMHQPLATPAPLPAGLPQAPGGPPQAPSGLPQAPLGTRQLPGTSQLPSAPPPPVAPQPLAAQQAPSAQPPASAAAWHGSPAADGNGTWYYQADTYPARQNGTGPQHAAPAASGPGSGLQAGYPTAVPNGYAQLPDGTPLTGPAQLSGPGQVSGGAAYGSAPAQYAQPPQPAQAFQPPQVVAPRQALQPPQAPHSPQPMQLTQPTQMPHVTQQALGAPQTQQIPQAQPAVPAAAAVQFPPPSLAAPRAPLAPPPPPPSPAALVAPAPAPAPVPVAAPVASPQNEQAASDASVAPVLPSTPIPTLPPPAAMPGPSLPGALSKLTGAVRGRRAARKPRLAMSAVFADLVDMADIPRSAYAVDEEVTGAICLFKTDGGYEVFSCAEDARHEVRFFEDEEAAYFYLFGVLAAEALRNGRLSPRHS